MKIHSINYYEHIDSPNKNPWEISEVVFAKKFNLVVGKNATGKTTLTY